MHDPLIGQYLGNYRIDSVIGRGGMAVVYYGWDDGLDRPVAVKVIDARYRDNPAYTERFIQEARTVATWRHDNILQVYYAGQQAELYYFVMEYVDGLNLAQVLKQYASEAALMPHEDVLKIGWAVAIALDYAHKRGVIHRDVKPSNVMVGKDGRITLTDFGLAMNTLQGSMGGTFGSPQYIAPEQARNSSMAVPESDLYALGVMLFEMLTGSVPFEDPSPMALAIQHLTQPPPPLRELNPNLSEALEVVLLKALSKQPADRYQTGATLMNAVAATLNEPVTGASFGVAMPVLSRLSVAERVSMYMPPPPPGVAQSSSVVTGSSTTGPFPPPLTTHPDSSTGNGIRFKVMALLVAVIGLCLLLGAGWVLFGVGDGAIVSNLFASPTPGALVTVEPAETETEESLAATEPTAQSGAIDTAVASPASTEPTAVIEEQTPIAQPTEISAQETSGPQATAPPTGLPTAAPAGLRLVMLYNLTSFYVYNPDREERIQVSQLDFESLDANGQFSGYSFEGVRWAQFYSFLNPLNCVRLEVPPTGWLRPSQCRQYNATVTPEADGELIFWTMRDNVVAFRVLWQGAEAGQCDVNANQCEVFLP